MSTKFAFVSTFALMLLLNGITAGVVTQSLAKETKKNDKKSVAVAIVSTQQRSVEKKKDGDKKKEITLASASGFYQPALMKPASLRCHRHHRYSYNA